ncbi:MAG: ABC transporter ATP-binding protein [Lentisphaeria bacterium]|nr:ABC transporter ATP-binding protein [Lentisphaeria bacterium]MBR2720166.1 ABC transporter ATP-binding protein [Lentisphaeria bacterium]
MKNSRKEPDRKDILSQYDNQSFGKVWEILTPYRSMLYGSIISLILFNLTALGLPWMLKISIDRILPNADELLFWVLACVMLILYLMRSLLRYIACYTIDYLGVRVMIDLRQKVFSHLQSLSLRFYEEYRTGKLISNVISDVAMLQVLIRTLTQLGEQVFQLIIISGLLLVINWQLALLVFLTIPIHYLNFHYFREEMRKDSMVLQEKLSEISANLSETITGVKVVKSFAKEYSESLRFFQNLRPVADMQMRLTVESVGLWAFFDTIALLTYLSIIGAGIWMVKINSITIGEFVAFYTYVGMMLTPINILSGLSITFAQGMVGAGRIVKLLNTIPEIKESPNPVLVEKLTGNIEFRNVTFSYDAEKGNTIDNFSLKITPGQKVALVGPSGSGKSTISNLLLRFYDVTGGAIRVDNLDIRKLRLAPFRDNIGIVLQEPFLFSGTIRDNIAYAVKREVKEEEIIAAARMANVEEFVQNLPEGYDTVIGENGASLSGGQKQRLAIARAVLKNPSILILDEATSALDTVSEYLVQDALDKLMQGKTTIIIAHRLSTIKNADVIVVLDRGRIVQQGTHDELMAQKGVYSELYQTQAKMSREG